MSRWRIRHEMNYTFITKDTGLACTTTMRYAPKTVNMITGFTGRFLVDGLVEEMSLYAAIVEVCWIAKPRKKYDLHLYNRRRPAGFDV